MPCTLAVALGELDLFTLTLPFDAVSRSGDQRESNNNVEFLIPIILAKIMFRAVSLVETE